ncbi:3-isopropylmalate dehydrogenase [compost metagenome]
MRILVLPGDGIGPEIVESSMSVLQAANKKFDLDLSFDYEDVGFTSLDKYGPTLRDEVLERPRATTASFSAPNRTPTIQCLKRAVVTFPPVSALAWISMPTYVLPVLVRS